MAGSREERCSRTKREEERNLGCGESRIGDAESSHPRQAARSERSALRFGAGSPESSFHTA